jgi:predicted small metal-binding protein
MKRLSCHDVGVDCDAVFEGETEDEVMAVAAQHAAEKHNLDPIPPQVATKCRENIHDA